MDQDKHGTDVRRLALHFQGAGDRASCGNGHMGRAIMPQSTNGSTRMISPGIAERQAKALLFGRSVGHLHHRKSLPLMASNDQASTNRVSLQPALRAAMSEARDIEILFALWEQNVETVRAINRSLDQHHLQKSGMAPQLVAHLKQCAVALAKRHQIPPKPRSNISAEHNDKD